jgi:hypothetical protein
MEDPFGFADLLIDQIIQYSGDIYDCLHVFIARKYHVETLHNAYFENKLCIEKAHPDKIIQTFMAKGVFNHEILLRT